MRISDWSVRQFLAAATLLTTALCGLVAYTNFRLDPLGVFAIGPSERRISIPITNERFVKYMLAQNYIPNNFDALLIGGSNSDNLPVDVTSEETIYNGSLNASNVQEMLPLVERATRDSEVKTIYYCLSPYQFKNAYYKTNVRMETVGREAWGSITLLRFYSARSGLLGPAKAHNNASGVMHDDFYLPFTNWWEKYETSQQRAPKTFPFALGAAQQLSEIGRLCRERNIRLVPFLHPRPVLLYEKFEKVAMEDFASKAASLLGVPVLNPNVSGTASMREFLAEPRHFRDGQHFTKEGAATLWPELYQWLQSTPK